MQGTLPNADAAWLHMDRPTNLMIITAVLWFDETPDWERLRALVQARLTDRFPRFRAGVAESRLPLGRCRWVEAADFDPGAHMHRLRLPPPGGHTELQRLVSDVMSRPIDHRRPLWDLYLVDGRGDGAAVIARLHHCLADGISLARVLLSLTDAEPDAGLEPVLPLEASRQAPGLAHVLEDARQLAAAMGREGKLLLGDGAHRLRRGREGLAAARALAKLVFLGPDRRSPLKGRMAVPKAAAWSRPLPLSEVKAVGHALGGTVNDVMLAATAGALGRYFAARSRPAEDVRAIVPYNLRPLERPISADLGNRFGLVFVTLPVGIADPLARLHETTRRMAAIKRSPEGVVAFGILSVLGTLPVFLEARAVDFFGAKASAVMTNVPGPREPVYLAGRRVLGVMAWVPQSAHISLGVTLFSYDGRISIGLGTDAGLVPDPERIVEAFEAEIRILARLAAREGTFDPPAPPPLKVAP